MNLKYWEEYYNKHTSDTPSQFAFFVEEYFPRHSRILDVGAGNLRDTHYFNSQGHYTYPVDQVYGSTIEQLVATNRKADVIYLRWILHAIEPELADILLSWAKKHGDLICIEARTTKDKSFKDDHKRYPVDVEALMEKLEDTNVIYREVGTGLSKVGKNDPHLIRVVCKTSQS